jgi:hypothetical protein
VVIVQDYLEDDVYEDESSQDEFEEEGAGKEELFSEMPVFEARWLVICLIVVAPLWIWPFDFPQIFAQFGVSILKAAGWLVGIALMVVVSSVGFSAIGKALLKSAHPQSDNSSEMPSHS